MFAKNRAGVASLKRALTCETFEQDDSGGIQIGGWTYIALERTRLLRRHVSHHLKPIGVGQMLGVEWNRSTET